MPHTKSSHNDSTGSGAHTLPQLIGADSLKSVNRHVLDGGKVHVWLGDLKAWEEAKIR